MLYSRTAGQMEDMVDSFEKTLMLLSPVKEGMGLSVLDRTCGDDDGGDLFYSELAALQAKEEAQAQATRGGASERCSSLSIGEVRYGSEAQQVLGGVITKDTQYATARDNCWESIRLEFWTKKHYLHDHFYTEIYSRTHRAWTC